MFGYSLEFYFLFLMKSHLQSYPCPLQINSFWNLGFLLGITIILQIITGIFLGLHYTSDLNSAYSSIFFFIREIYYGWSLRYLHSSGASFVFLFQFLHLGRAISYGSYFYNPNTWFSGILLFFFLMATAFMGYVLPFGQMSFWGATATKVLSLNLVWEVVITLQRHFYNLWSQHVILQNERNLRSCCTRAVILCKDVLEANAFGNLAHETSEGVTRR